MKWSLNCHSADNDIQHPMINSKFRLPSATSELWGPRSQHLSHIFLWQISWELFSCLRISERRLAVRLMQLVLKTRPSTWKGKAPEKNVDKLSPKSDERQHLTACDAGFAHVKWAEPDETSWRIRQAGSDLYDKKCKNQEQDLALSAEKCATLFELWHCTSLGASSAAGNPGRFVRVRYGNKIMEKHFPAFDQYLIVFVRSISK